MATPVREGVCALCEEVQRKRKRTESQPHAFTCHVDLSIFHKKQHKQRDKEANIERQTRKKTTIQKLERIVSALRNTLGGSIVVHLLGHVTNDCYLGHFDDFVALRFRELIQSGELYVDVYTRKWIETEDFVVITVTKSDTISTVDFNTKVSSDFDNISPTLSNIRLILSKTKRAKVVPPRIRGIGPDIQELHENRSTQLKCYMPKESQVNKRDDEYVSQVVCHVWDDLKFKYNLTSMSKVDGGGSFYVGIEERDVTKTYLCKTPEISGFDLHETHRAHFKDLFLAKVKANVSALTLDGSFIEDIEGQNLFEFGFHDYQGKTVLEIAVRYFDGILFYDKQGPRAYEIRHNIIERMGRGEWLRRIRQMKHQLIDC